MLRRCRCRLSPSCGGNLDLLLSLFLLEAQEVAARAPSPPGGRPLVSAQLGVQGFLELLQPCAAPPTCGGCAPSALLGRRGRGGLGWRGPRSCRSYLGFGPILGHCTAASSQAAAQERLQQSLELAHVPRGRPQLLLQGRSYAAVEAGDHPKTFCRHHVVLVRKASQGLLRRSDCSGPGIGGSRLALGQAGLRLAERQLLLPPRRRR
mmetsp:Transcript_55299/g.112905  ORF Transcript_55299/g.112905 Transcript_55299/m.112905 type:complete len:207 (+) Transcript_55299:366-986(+)